MTEGSTSNIYLNLSSQDNTHSEEHVLSQQDQNGKRKRQVGGRPREQIWNYYKTSSPDAQGYRDAACNYCSKYWGRGRPGEMEVHLANICTGVPREIKDYWQEFLANKISNYKRTNNTKSSNLKQPNQIDNESIESMSIYEQNEIDKAILKAWVMAGIPFETI